MPALPPGDNRIAWQTTGTKHNYHRLNHHIILIEQKGLGSRGRGSRGAREPVGDRLPLLKRSEEYNSQTG